MSQILEKLKSIKGEMAELCDHISKDYPQSDNNSQHKPFTPETNSAIKRLAQKVESIVEKMPEGALKKELEDRKNSSEMYQDFMK
jgi:hypothetical protein